ncbi:GlxA family transcriptional regulator [Kiloniella sp. b19]|uniref:GlxA family transcriptional regulator n=1 Tax=Kiloniella sp. GXU_MW_B19 TaxID=3141326 RepID=UPI0031D62698
MHVAVLLFEGFSNMVLSCLLEPLRAVRDQQSPDINWVILSPDNQPIKSSSGLRIAPDQNWQDLVRADLLIVLSSYHYQTHAHSRTSKLLHSLSGKSASILGADAGTWLLAKAGLLKDKEATAHWQLLNELAETFPDLNVREETFVKDGKIWTCGGASSAMALMLDFIEENFGAACAFDVSSLFLHDISQTREASPVFSPRGSPRLHRLLTLMSDNMEQPLSLEELARKANMSLRNMHRLFLSEIRTAPGRYYQLLRLSRARDLVLSTQLPLGEIALRCGFSGAPSLSKAFKGIYGFPPGTLRQGNNSKGREP